MGEESNMLLCLNGVSGWKTSPTSESLVAYFGAMWPWLLATAQNVSRSPELGADLASFTVDWFTQRPEKASRWADTPLTFSLMLVNFMRTQNRHRNGADRHNTSTWGAELSIKHNPTRTFRMSSEADDETSRGDVLFWEEPDQLWLERRFDEAEIEKIAAVRRVVHRLPSHLQTVYRCHVEEMMPVRAIAKEYGMSMSSAFREVQAMRRAVLELLEDETKTK